MELLRTKDNEIEALRKKLRVKKEKIHKLRRQLADLKERFGNTLTIPPLSVEAQSHPTKTSSSHSEKSMSESQITHNNSNFSLQIVQSD
jgi:predicted RNase H-like nuclease (RuvC/YqgF family)